MPGKRYDPHGAGSRYDPYDTGRRVNSGRSDGSRQHRKKRNGALSAGYVLVLTAVCVVTLLLCVHYLQLRSQLIHQNETIAAMESALNQLKAENDAYADKAQASLDMGAIKDKALNELGLHYASESQIRYYNADDESYVRQYENVP
ncbi:MAG: hypothetical protein J5973_01530 [Eubacterium sp.]|nr:hypothetical protein [Eubacterium sp.]